MAITISSKAALNSLAQESAFYPVETGPLTSKHFEGNRTLQGINTGQVRAIGRGRNDNDRTAVRQLQKALRTIIPEMIVSTPDIIRQADNLPINGHFGKDTESLIRHFQGNTSSLVNGVDGLVGRRTIKAMDMELNRIGHYDEDTGETIFNVQSSEPVGENTVLFVTDPAIGDFVPLYDRPEIDEDELIAKAPMLQLSVGDVVLVRNKLPANKPDWYYVELVSIYKSNDTTTVDSLISEAIDQNNSIKGFVPGRFLWKYWENGNPPMPDVHSQLWPIPPDFNAQAYSHDKLLEIIQQTYYDELIIELPQRPSDQGGEKKHVTFNGRGAVNINDAYFKFCLNILLYANNPLSERLPDGATRSIFLDPTADLDWYSEEDVENARARVDEFIDQTPPNDLGDLYERFLGSLLNDSSKNYDYIIGGKVRVLLNPGDRMWIPSRQLVNGLWRKLAYFHPVQNTENDDDILELAQEAVAFCFPFRSQGYRLRVGIGATFGLPIGADFEGDISIWRLDTNSDKDIVLKISAFGSLSVQADTGVGAGFGVWLGSDRFKDKDKRPGIGASMGIDIEAGGKKSVLVEFEIPIVGLDPITNNMAAALYGGIAGLTAFVFPSAAPFALMQAINSLNLNLWNYVTKFKVYLGSFGRAGAGASLGFKYGVKEKEDAWKEANLDTSAFRAPSLLSLLSGASSKGGATGSVDMGAGVELEIEYPYSWANCYNEKLKIRVPSKVKITAFGEGQFHLSFFTSLSKGLLGLPFLPSFTAGRGLGLKVSLEYDLEGEPGVIKNQDLSLKTKDFEFSFDRFIKQSSKKVSTYWFSGNLDIYDGPAFETAYTFNLKKLIDNFLREKTGLRLGNYVLKNSTFTDNFLALTNLLDGVEFKKRFNMAFISKAYGDAVGRQLVSSRWQQNHAEFISKKNRISGLKSSVYFDLNYELNGGQYIRFVRAFLLYVRMTVAKGNEEATPEAIEYIDSKIETIFEGDLTSGQTIDNVLELYNDETLEGFLEQYAELSDVFWFAINQLLGLMGDIVGLGDIEENIREQEEDQTVIEFLQAFLTSFTEFMTNITIAMHAESAWGVSVSGRAAKGFKVRLDTNLEIGLLAHSDFIKNDRFHPNAYWNRTISDFLELEPVNINPSNNPEPIKLSSTNFKQKNLDILFRILFDEKN